VLVTTSERTIAATIFLTPGSSPRWTLNVQSEVGGKGNRDDQDCSRLLKRLI
jgi:hypothetical protein